MNTPHKYADVIKAWADGKPIQFKYMNGSSWNDFFHDERAQHVDFAPLPGFNNHNAEWRIKPSYPTLGEIAKKAYYAFQREGIGAASISHWNAAAAAIKAAIESGEYS